MASAGHHGLAAGSQMQRSMAWSPAEPRIIFQVNFACILPPCCSDGSSVITPIQAWYLLKLTYPPWLETKLQKDRLASLHASSDRYKYLKGPFVCLFRTHGRACELVGLGNVNEYNCLSAQRTGFPGTLRSGEVLRDLSAKECPWQPALGFLGDTGDWLEANAGSTLEWGPGKNNATIFAWRRIGADMPITR